MQVPHHFIRPSSNSEKISVYLVICSFTPVIPPEFLSSALFCFYETSPCYQLTIPGTGQGVTLHSTSIMPAFAMLAT